LIWSISSNSSVEFNDQFDGERALDHIQNQIEFGPRILTNLEAKKQTLDYMEEHLRPLATRVTRQSFSFNGLEGVNLWATFVSSHKNANQNRLMFGAHWDTRPISEKENDHNKRVQPTLGANDGASGVAVLLELARIFALNPPPINVDLIFFDLEDMGNINGLDFAIGSHQFVKKNAFYRPSGGVILDMVCDKNLSIPRELYSKNQAKNLMDRIWHIAEKQNAKAFLKTDGTFITDDHLPFLKVGIPVVDLIHYPFPDYWHTTRDTLDKCSSHSLETVGKVVASLVYD
jgi:Zn-dependent M28 family amino/carboxypeptidase